MDWGDLLRGLMLLIAIPVLLLFLLIVVTNFVLQSSEPFLPFGAHLRPSAIYFMVGVILVVFVLAALTRPAKAPLNWPGLIWRLALLVAIPLLLLAIVAIGRQVILL